MRPEEYTSYFKSVIAFGKIRILKDEEEIRKAIALLAIKYNSQDSIEKRERAIEAGYANLCMLELKVEHLTGKQAKELIDKK